MVGDNKVDRFDIKNGKEFVRMSKKLKVQKLSKFQKLKSKKLAKSKKLSKSWNLSNFNTKKVGPNILTSDTRITFNCLQLAFTKTLIL